MHMHIHTHARRFGQFLKEQQSLRALAVESGLVGEKFFLWLQLKAFLKTQFGASVAPRREASVMGMHVPRTEVNCISSEIAQKKQQSEQDISLLCKRDQRNGQMQQREEITESQNVLRHKTSLFSSICMKFPVSSPAI